MMHGRGYNGFNHDFMGVNGYGFMHNEIGMFIMCAIFVVAAAAIAVIYFARRNRLRRPASEALDVLKIKFAKGELTEEEYLRRKKVIE